MYKYEVRYMTDQFEFAVSNVFRPLHTSSSVDRIIRDFSGRNWTIVSVTVKPLDTHERDMFKAMDISTILPLLRG